MVRVRVRVSLLGGGRCARRVDHARLLEAPREHFARSAAWAKVPRPLVLKYALKQDAVV